MRKFFLYWLPLILYAFLIFYLSSRSGDTLPRIDIPHFDKIVHFIEYAIFGFLLLRALRIDKTKVFNMDLRLFVIIISVIFGISDEFHQVFVPNRTPDLLDFISDSIGAFVGQLFIRKK
ncbi:MAG: VanZ family protein [Candidatus Omnitrophota bacterium]